MTFVLKDIRKIAALMTVVGLWTAPAALAIAGGPTLELYTSTSSYDTGDDIMVEIRIDTTTFDVSGAEIHLSFPGGGFEVVSLDAGTFLTVILSSAQSDSDSATITVGSGTSPKNGQGTVAVLRLRALQAGTFDIELEESTQIAAAGESGDVKDTLTGVTLFILSDGDSATQTSAAQSATSAMTTGNNSGSTTVTSQAGQVPTGPAQVTVIALILASISAVAYVGYTSTDWFRRHEAGDIVDQTEGEKDRGDFKS